MNPGLLLLMRPSQRYFEHVIGIRHYPHPYHPPKNEEHKDKETEKKKKKRDKEQNDVTAQCAS